jgi:ketosteroid isomerase-like protein
VSHSENEKDDIRAAASCLKEALRQKDVAVALSLMTDDVVIVGGVGAPVAGHDAVRKLLSTELPWNYTADELPVDSTVEMLGDMAIIVSNGLAVVKPEDPTLSLPMFTVSGRTISVFRRQVDGWKLARLISLLAKAK